ncbi:amidohydrolase family protein [Cryptosporangium minutisporangium]|uniref:Amidohydrolase family protein n=1 Tax=Cryptosporangium minutisporangium TaxID=113569 RepID=A0ABP6T4C8_9ACTN
MRIALVDAHMIPADGSPELPTATLLIEDGVITALGPGLRPPPDAEVIDASGLVAIPGLVDGHRHVWQAPLRGIGADMTLADYFRTVLGRALSAYRPEDAHAAALLGAAEALDAGVTTLFDWSNTLVTAEHTDAVVDAFTVAGVRAVVASGSPDREDDARRLAKSTGRVTGALAILGPEAGDWDDAVRHLAFGRELGVTVSFHASGGPGGSVERLADAGLLGPDLNLVHLNAMTDEDAARLVESGAGVTITPVVEATMGHGASPYGRFRDAGGRAGLGTDVVVNATPDLFEPLRDTLRTERMRTHTLVPAADFLPAVTLDSARAIGLADEVGALTVGRRADVVLLDGLSHLTGAGTLAGAVVTALGPANVQTVLVDGRVVKRDGALVDHDLATLRAAGDAIARRVLA